MFGMNMNQAEYFRARLYKYDNELEDHEKEFKTLWFSKELSGNEEDSYGPQRGLILGKRKWVGKTTTGHKIEVHDKIEILDGGFVGYMVTGVRDDDSDTYSQSMMMFPGLKDFIPKVVELNYDNR